jgi:hypothetical protein
LVMTLQRLKGITSGNSLPKTLLIAYNASLCSAS